jgi:hypothetical protein
MASADDDRRELFDRLEAGLGSRGAALVMAHLPPVGWNELATRSDIRELRGELLARIASAQTTMTATMIGTMIGLSGLVFAVASFAR